MRNRASRGAAARTRLPTPILVKRGDLPLATNRSSDKPEYLSERAYQAVFAQIINGEFRPGDHLKEEDLVAKLGVSRTVIRHVLTRLTAEGLLTDTPKKGKCVTSVDENRIAKLIPIRIALEQLAVKEAIAHLNHERENELKQFAEKLKEPNLDLAAQGALEVSLHRRIWDFSQNEELARMLNQIIRHFHLVSKAGFLAPHYRRNHAGLAMLQLFCEREHSPAGHQLLVEAICRKDPGAASQAVADHVNALWSLSADDFEKKIGDLLQNYLHASKSK